MPNAWGQSWGGDTRAWGVSWGSSPGPPPAAVGAAIIPSGGFHPWLGPHHYARQRREFYASAVPVKTAAIIQALAARQLEDLRLTKKRQEAVLRQELKVKGIEFEARFLEVLALERELLIELEIAERLRARMQHDELMLLIAVAASV